VFFSIAISYSILHIPHDAFGVNQPEIRLSQREEISIEEAGDETAKGLIVSKNKQLTKAASKNLLRLKARFLQC